jgi:uncharacterized protein YceH (UPF0502 family)
MAAAAARNVAPPPSRTLLDVDADPVEIRILGCLIEKQRTTPDVYPLSLNSLRSACNQTTNRDPVVSYEEGEIRAALERLGRKRWTRLASGAGSRAAKYRHLLDEALSLDGAQLSLLAVLMLRGPQTPGELKQRTERMQRFESLADVEHALDGLIDRQLVARLSRRPGQKEERFAQLLGEEDVVARAAAPAAPEVVGTPAVPFALEARVARLEDEVARLTAALDSLQGR